MRVYFLDTSVVMYAVGAAHPYKKPCAEILLRIGRGDLSAVTDTEVFQELLYCYSAIGEREKGLAVAQDLLVLLAEVLPVTKEDIGLTLYLHRKYRAINPRDVIHIAAMINNGLSQIISTDKDFDLIEEIRRVDPAML